MSRVSLLRLVGLCALILGSSPTRAQRSDSCGGEFARISTSVASPLSADDRAQLLKLRLKSADPAEARFAERRPKQINGNRIGLLTADGRQSTHRVLESADWARPETEVLPDGSVVHKVYASGLYVFEVDEDRFYRGGLLGGGKRKSIITLFPDGRRQLGPYHTGSLSWDGHKVNWAGTPFADEGYVGYKGTMTQPYRMAGAQSTDAKLPEVKYHNPGRDRHAYKVSYDAQGREIWKDQGSMFGHVPSIDQMVKPSAADLEAMARKRFPAGNDSQIKAEIARLKKRYRVDPAEDGGIGIDADWDHHGYGGRVLLDADSRPIKVDGNYWFLYESVETRTVAHPSGRPERIPGVTGMRLQRMKDPYTLYQKGEKLPDGRIVGDPIVAFDPDSAASPDLPKRATPYPETIRGTGKGWAHLIEGLNASDGPITIEGKQFWVGTASSGDYIAIGKTGERYYGTNVLFRTAEEGPIGQWRPVLNEKDDLVNFTREFEDRYNLGWVGRMDVFPRRTLRPNGPGGAPVEVTEWWALVHGIDLDTLPASFTRDGSWPKQAEFEQAFRNGYLVPVNWKLKDGKPWLEIEDPDLSPADIRRLSPRLPKVKQQKTLGSAAN